MAGGSEYTMTASSYQVSESWSRHVTNRSRELQGKNHAGQVAVTCHECSATFDVGRERLRSAMFEPRCFECHQRGVKVRGGE